MDYFGNKCAVCNNVFKKGDDIVVCPECGTPSHRECYFNNGKCINEDKHKDGYVYEPTSADNNTSGNQADTITCPKCNTENDKNLFFCTNCKSPLNVSQPNQNPYPGNGPMPNNQGYPNVVMFDPMAGISTDEDMGDGVTAGEMTKFVRNNTPYFITIFFYIKKFLKSRFNFCAAIFMGGYLLYRKMYKLGAIVTAIQAMVMILSMYLNYVILVDPVYSPLLEAAVAYDITAYQTALTSLTGTQIGLFYVYFALQFITLVMRFVIGACANRMYYNHCKKTIINIKSKYTTKNDIDNAFKAKGGVNKALAFSLIVAYFIIQYVPNFFI